MALNVTVADLSAGCGNSAVAEPSLAQWDRGQILQITGVELPVFYQVEFCTDASSAAVTMIGGESGVEIPNALLEDGLPIKAYIVLHEGEDDRETEYWITIHVRQRKPPSDDVPDPGQASAIDQAIAALDNAVELTDGFRQDAEAWAVGERDGVPVESGDPAYQNNAEFYAGEAAGSAEDAEAWAVGKRSGTDVGPTDETYENNAKYWAGQADERGQAKATLAESWAVGGTGTRPGENTDNAKHYAELAAQGAEESGYAWFDVNDENGHLYIYISDNLSEDVSFSVVEATGHLEVTYS